MTRRQSTHKRHDRAARSLEPRREGTRTAVGAASSAGGHRAADDGGRRKR